jgi:hypothetical protein
MNLLRDGNGKKVLLGDLVDEWYINEVVVASRHTNWRP